MGMSLSNVPNVSALNNFSSREMSNLEGNAFNSAKATLAFVITMDILGDYLLGNKVELGKLWANLRSQRTPAHLQSPKKTQQRSEIFRKRMAKAS